MKKGKIVREEDGGKGAYFTMKIKYGNLYEPTDEKTEATAKKKNYENEKSRL